MFVPGDVISHSEMCAEEEKNLQAGMHFRHRGNVSIVLMSRRPNAPYADRVEDNGKTLIYEGHNVSRRWAPNPQQVDQPLYTPNGHLTQNGLFHLSAIEHQTKGTPPDLVRVYEKIMDGVWVFNGTFSLKDAFSEQSNGRTVWKFRLEVAENIADDTTDSRLQEPEHNRLIPSSVKREVWRRDQGKCVLCGSTKNLHFDHDLPFSRGGASITAANIRLLCARCNLRKSNRIE